MQTPSFPLALGLLWVATLAGSTTGRAVVITAWNFNNDAVATNASPAVSTGTGASQALGFNGTTYNGTASVESSDVLKATGNDAGSSDQATTNNIWRLRGSNGWSSNAPIGSQGAQFSLNTTGYTNLQLQFDWYCTTAGERNLQVQYTTNGTTFVNVPTGLYSATTYNSVQSGASVGNTLVLTNTTSANTVPGTYLQAPAQGWTNAISINLGGITAAIDDPNFAVRFVNASTGADNTIPAGTALDNTKGNWRFDAVTFSGVAAAPEPGTLALVGLGLAGVGWLVRSRRS